MLVRSVGLHHPHRGDEATLIAVEGDLGPIRRPFRIEGIPFRAGQPGEPRTVGVHDVDGAGGHRAPGEGELRPVGGEPGVEVVEPRLVGELSAASPISIHSVDLLIPREIPLENDLGSVRRPVVRKRSGVALRFMEQHPGRVVRARDRHVVQVAGSILV